VRTNDPARPEWIFTIRADVRVAVQVVPQEVFLLSNREGARTVPALLVRRDPSATGVLSIGNVTASEPWLRVRAERVDAPRPPADGLPGAAPGDFILRAEVADDAPWGRTRATVRFRTGMPEQPEAELVVSVDRRPLITLSSDRIALAPDGTGTVLGSLRAGIDPATLVVSAEGGIRVETERAGPRQFRFHLARDATARGAGAVVFRAGGETYRVPVAGP